MFSHKLYRFSIFVLIAVFVFLIVIYTARNLNDTPQPQDKDDFAHLTAALSIDASTIHSLERETYVYDTPLIDLETDNLEPIWSLIKEETNDRELVWQLTNERWLQFREEKKANLWQPDFSNIEAYTASVAENRQHLQTYLGELHPNRRGSMLDETIIDLPPNNYLADVPLTHLIVQSRVPELRFDAYVVEPPPDRQNGWAVVAVHGHSSSAEKMVGFGEEDYTRRMALRLARQGFWVIVPNVSSSEKLNNVASAHAALYGYTLYGIMVEFLQSTLDIAQERGYQKIGLMGISNGGFLALLTAGLDDRPDFVVASGILGPFYKNTVLAQTEKIGKDYFFYFNGPFWLEFDVAELAFLVAPRPLIFTVGTEDETVEGWQPEYERVRAVYEQLKIPHRLGLVQFLGKHELDEDHTILLLSEWVRGN